MTTAEKLQKFLDCSMTDARTKSSAAFEEYKKAQDDMFQEHAANEEKQAQLGLRYEADRCEREINLELAREQIHIKKEFGAMTRALKDELFVEVQNLLEEYMRSPAYERYLVRKIKEAVAFAQGQEMTVYIDPEDISRRQQLERETKTAVSISAYSFGGGMRAVIPARHILIDHSFDTKLKELKENFSLEEFSLDIEADGVNEEEGESDGADRSKDA